MLCSANRTFLHNGVILAECIFFNNIFQTDCAFSFSRQTGHLAMETLLSLTSKRAGDWFKEELRLLGGLDHIVDKGLLLLLCICSSDLYSIKDLFVIYREREIC